MLPTPTRVFWSSNAALMGVRVLLAITTEVYAFLVARTPGEERVLIRQRLDQEKSGARVLPNLAAKDGEA